MTAITVHVTGDDFSRFVILNRTLLLNVANVRRKGLNKKVIIVQLAKKPLTTNGVKILKCKITLSKFSTDINVTNILEMSYHTARQQNRPKRR
jgi:hypothetical protein